MSSNDRPGQDAHVQKWVRQYLASLGEGKDRPTLDDLNDALAEDIQHMNEAASHEGVTTAEHQQKTTEVHHHDYHQDVVISGGHALTGAEPLGAIAFVVVMQKMTEALQKIDDLNLVAVGEQTIDELKALSTSIGEVWDQFKADTEQVIEDVKEQMTELLSPERAQARPPAGQQEKSTELGGKQVDADIAEIRRQQDEQELKGAQEKERAGQAAQVAERREQLAKKYEGSPDQEQYLKQFDEAAKLAADALARQQAAQLQKLQEQQLQGPVR